MKELIRKRATDNFISLGFKSFTMDDLAGQMGMSKKTLYEYYPSKNDLVEDCVEGIIAEVEKCDFFQGEKNVIENAFTHSTEFIKAYKITNHRPIWELRKYYPKQHEKLERRLKEIDIIQIKKMLEQGWEEDIFRKDVDICFFTFFYSNFSRMVVEETFLTEENYSFIDIVHKKIEYVFRILVNEKGMQLLENQLVKNKQ